MWQSGPGIAPRRGIELRCLTKCVCDLRRYDVDNSTMVIIESIVLSRVKREYAENRISQGEGCTYATSEPHGQICGYVAEIECRIGVGNDLPIRGHPPAESLAD